MEEENSTNLPPSPSTSDKKGVIILGETGVGKSNLGNFLIKANDFKTSSSTNSETQHVFYGESKEIIVIDSPGANDSSQNDDIEEEHLIEIVKAFKKAKYLNTILILLNYQQPRLSKNLKIMIKLFSSIFKISFFLKHLGIVFTRCFDEDGRPEQEDLDEKKKEWDKEIKLIIKSTLINEELTDDKIQYFFVNLNPKKKKLDKGTDEEMTRLKLWIISNEFINTDIVEENDHPGYKEEEEEQEYEEKNIEGEKLVIKKFKKIRKKLIYIDGSVKYDGDWVTSLVETREEAIERFQELNSSIQQFKKNNEDLLNQLKEAKENNNLELERLRLEYNTRVQEARAQAEIASSNNNRGIISDVLGLIFGGLTLSIFGGGGNSSSTNDF
jgi:GTP-binding protein EngB required for normal cell division